MNENNVNNITGSNIDISDIDEETAKELKGDNIGDTLYSQSFVLKTLLKLSELEWNEEFEEDLCLLWDMTVEKDVSDFLLDMAYPSIACSAILKYSDNNRLIEIMIGILANIYCCGCENQMNQQELEIILSILNSDDHLILIQIMRFITVSVETSLIFANILSQDFIEKMCFILRNSVNEQLLLKTFESTAKLTTDFRLNDKYVDFNLFQSVLICYETLINCDDDEEFEPETQEQQTPIRYMLECVTNIWSYISKYKKEQLFSEIEKYSYMLSKELAKILIFFSDEKYFLPVTEQSEFFILAISYIFINMNLKYIPGVYSANLKMLYLLISNEYETADLINSIKSLLSYLSST